MEILRYVTESGRDLIRDWLDHLGDAKSAARIVMRMDRLAAGNFGDCKPVGEGVWELRIDFGPGYPHLLLDRPPGVRAAVLRRRQTDTIDRHRQSDQIFSGLQAKDIQAMKSKASISHERAVVEHLRDDPEFAAEYLKAALEDTDEPKALLLALRRITEARGGFAKVAKAAGIERESLHRALSASGNPRLSTLIGVMKAVGLKLTVEIGNAART